MLLVRHSARSGLALQSIREEAQEFCDYRFCISLITRDDTNASTNHAHQRTLLGVRESPLIGRKYS